MPSLDTFGSYMAEYSQEVTKKAEEAFKAAAMKGSAFMKATISANASTGTDWHREKNRANNYDDNARFGSKINFRGYAPSAAPKTMLNSVERGDIQESPNGFSVSFGWLNRQETYFGQQDMGTYRPNGVGMGLLNKAQNRIIGKDLGAALAAEGELMKKMRAAKFKSKGRFF